MVQLVVGTEGRIFNVHRDLICDRVDFFRQSFAGGFAESHTNSMRLEEDDPNIFAMLIGWVYGNAIAPPSEVDRQADIGPFVKLYRLADKLCMEHLKNDTMDLVRKLCRGKSTKMEAITLLKENGLHDCVMKRFLIRQVAYEILKLGYFPNDEGVTNILRAGGDDAIELVNEMAEAAHDDFHDIMSHPCYDDDCNWHEHETTKECIVKAAKV